MSNNPESYDFIEEPIRKILNTEKSDLGYLLSDVKNFVLALELYPYYKLISYEKEGF